MDRLVYFLVAILFTLLSLLSLMSLLGCASLSPRPDPSRFFAVTSVLNQGRPA
jgi:hypothetical protein